MWKLLLCPTCGHQWSPAGEKTPRPTGRRRGYRRSRFRWRNQHPGWGSQPDERTLLACQREPERQERRHCYGDIDIRVWLRPHISVWIWPSTVFLNPNWNWHSFKLRSLCQAAACLPRLRMWECSDVIIYRKENRILFIFKHTFNERRIQPEPKYYFKIFVWTHSNQSGTVGHAWGISSL